jgi:glycosyltransferase involved in cell wall biosynthesis
MARGLPCIASTVGGIPELLPAEDLVPPGCGHGLAAKIREVLADPARQVEMSRRNQGRARDFHDHVLQPRRTEFFRQVRRITEIFLRKGAQPCPVYS